MAGAARQRGRGVALASWRVGIGPPGRNVWGGNGQTAPSGHTRIMAFEPFQ